VIASEYVLLDELGNLAVLAEVLVGAVTVLAADVVADRANNHVVDANVEVVKRTAATH
jgi:hypothetical protein